MSMNDKDFEYYDKNLNELALLCQHEPDRGLKITNNLQNKYGKSKNQYLVNFLKYCEITVYEWKGFIQLLRSRPELIETLDMADMMYLRREVGLTEQQLDYIELALKIFKEIDDSDPTFIKDMGPSEVISEELGKSVDFSQGEAEIDTIATVLERCRPGRVQKILGKTKLKYFGFKRIRVKSNLQVYSAANVLNFKKLGNIFFKVPTIVKSAFIFKFDIDEKFIECMLFEKVFNEFIGKKYNDLTVAKSFAAEEESLYLYENGTSRISWMSELNKVDWEETW